jgi:hypothetical protein
MIKDEENWLADRQRRLSHQLVWQASVPASYPLFVLVRPVKIRY